MELTNPSVTTLIKAMMSKDFIYRIKSKNDGRYYHLHLTPKGMQLAKVIPDSLNAVNDKFLSSLSNQELETLKNLLNKLNGCN